MVHGSDQGSGSFCSTVDSFVASDSIKLKPQRKEKKCLSGYSSSSSSSEQDLGKGPLTLPSQSEHPKHVSEQHISENNPFYNSDLIKSLSYEAAKELSERPKTGPTHTHSEATLYSKIILERLQVLSETETDFSIDEAIEIANATSILKILKRLEDNIEKAGQMAHSGALLVLEADIMAEKGRELLARSKRMLNLANLKLDSGELAIHKEKDTGNVAADGYKSPVLKRSNSAPALEIQPNNQEVGSIINSEFCNSEFERHNTEGFPGKSSSNMDIIRKEEQLVPKLRCQVNGAYFEKIGLTYFAVYSIAVTDAENRTWFVQRRFRNFERLHQHVKDINSNYPLTSLQFPSQKNYTLQLPPKWTLSSRDVAFIQYRCILLDQYLQDLLSIANVAEHHDEVLDFFSASSKNYSFEETPSGIKTLAVNVDDPVDDINVRQLKEVSDGQRRNFGGLPLLIDEGSSATIRWKM